MRDWRLLENRREAFQRSYSFNLTYKVHPGCVYSLLPAIAAEEGGSLESRMWLAWLNSNTQNPATSLLLYRASAGVPTRWDQAVDFWNSNFKKLEWDTDRRHQKSKFGEATEEWWLSGFSSPGSYPIGGTWSEWWKFGSDFPHWGRLSTWSGLEFFRILCPELGIPDADTLLLRDWSGSRSHRNGLGVIAGYDSVYWGPGDADVLGVVDELEELGLDLVREAQGRNIATPDDCSCSAPYDTCTHDPVPHRDVGYLTMESALCTYKSWHKPNRRYPGVYADMAYERIRKAEQRFPASSFSVLWEARQADLPEWLRLEDNPQDPGLSSPKQNHYRLSGEIPMMYHLFEDEGPSGFDLDVITGAFGIRKEKTWT